MRNTNGRFPSPLPDLVDLLNLWKPFDELPDDHDEIPKHQYCLSQPSGLTTASTSDLDIWRYEDYLRQKWACAEAMPESFDPRQLENARKSRFKPCMREQATSQSEDGLSSGEEEYEDEDDESPEVTPLAQKSNLDTLCPSQKNASTESLCSLVSVTSPLDTDEQLESYEGEVTINEASVENINRMKTRPRSTTLSVVERVQSDIPERQPTPRIRSGSKPPLSRSAFANSGLPCLQDGCNGRNSAALPAMYHRGQKYFPYKSRTVRM
ncbi:Uu.00g142990.m01.CDS01 [Anthostomella pinea]|uniref:Uu.00g142990.m01.CDS01 n=1 Tax=Anthostomella pinea TaxID=933095 RepID=A0AAI8YLH7_9PEZI|nr:Uu.00g142990.m01.CDS01 [Anthostomella pinea]